MNVKKTTSWKWSVLKLSNSLTHQARCVLRDAGRDSSFRLCNSHLSFIKELVVSISGETRDYRPKEGYGMSSISQSSIGPASSHNAFMEMHLKYAGRINGLRGVKKRILMSSHLSGCKI